MNQQNNNQEDRRDRLPLWLLFLLALLINFVCIFSSGWWALNLSSTVESVSASMLSGRQADYGVDDNDRFAPLSEDVLDEIERDETGLEMTPSGDTESSDGDEIVPFPPTATPSATAVTTEPAPSATNTTQPGNEPTATVTAAATQTAVATNTPTSQPATATPTYRWPTNTPLPTATSTPHTPSATNTPVPPPTNTPVPPPTNTPTPVPPPTNTPVPPPTNTPVPPPTNTPVPPPTNTPVSWPGETPLPPTPTLISTQTAPNS